MVEAFSVYRSGSRQYKQVVGGIIRRKVVAMLSKSAYAWMSLRDMDALKGIPTWWLLNPLSHVGAGFSPHVGAKSPDPLVTSVIRLNSGC
jgi:hypothetical protein